MRRSVPRHRVREILESERSLSGWERLTPQAPQQQLSGQQEQHQMQVFMWAGAPPADGLVLCSKTYVWLPSARPKAVANALMDMEWRLSWEPGFDGYRVLQTFPCGGEGEMPTTAQRTARGA
jgi:hypothetical protein